jgi:hypothetical protein
MPFLRIHTHRGEIMAFELQGWMLAFGISLPIVAVFIATHRTELIGRGKEIINTGKTYSDVAAA